jgi:hypothetical protein
LLLEALDIADVVRPRNDTVEGAVLKVVDASLLFDTRECGRDRGDGAERLVGVFGPDDTLPFLRVEVVEVPDRALDTERTDAMDGARDFGLPLGGVSEEFPGRGLVFSTRVRGGGLRGTGGEDVGVECRARACAVLAVRTEDTDTDEATELRLDAKESLCASAEFWTVVCATLRLGAGGFTREDAILAVSAS